MSNRCGEVTVTDLEERTLTISNAIFPNQTEVELEEGTYLDNGETYFIIPQFTITREK